MAGLVRVSRAEQYRNSAASLRLLAQKTRFPEGRDDLIRLAVGFDRLAHWIEVRETTAADTAD
ncbi:MAG: hypothetical protein ACREE4_08140 [Stellaceae bacterium]